MGKRVKLTDKQKKKIIADYTINNNLSETARINNVSDTTVKRVINASSKEVLKKVEQKGKENTQDILQYIDESFSKQKKVIDLSLKVLDEKLSKPDMFTNVRDVVTVYGILYDKALKSKELKLRQLELDQSKSSSDTFNKNLLNIATLIKNPAPIRTEKDFNDE